MTSLSSNMAARSLSRPSPTHLPSSSLPCRATRAPSLARSLNDRFWQIVLQKSKIEPRRKSRESRCLDVSIAARCDGAVTKVPGRFLQNDVVPHVARGGKHQRLLKFRSSPQKDFCNNIGTFDTYRSVLRLSVY